MRMRKQWLSLLVGLLAATSPMEAQLAPNMKYDGRPTLARLKYPTVSHPSGCQISDSPAGSGWGHDYPMSVRGLLKALTELTSIQAVPDSNKVLAIDDPEIMKYPMLMLTEPGCWDPTEAEAKALRSYLLKGGFLIADDFTFGVCTPENCALSIERFEAWMKRVLPEGQIIRLSASDPVFNGFFKIDPTGVVASSDRPAQIMGIYENNDPTKRLMVVGTYWSALGHQWRYVGNDIGSGIERGGSAYRLGMNYFIYGLSH